MSEKVLNTRIQLKYDLYSNWITVWENFVPKSGEVIFFEVPQSITDVQVTPPAVLFKVGNGETNLKNLPWGSAKAADVYGWAKAESWSINNLIDGGEREQTLITFIEAHSKNDEYAVEVRSGNLAFVKNSGATDESVTPIAFAVEGSGSTTDLFTVTDSEGGTKTVTLNLSGIDARLDAVEAALNTKVDKEITSTAGKAMIFNEADGGGAKFEYKDGTASYVGVHDKSNGVGAQIYVDKDTTSGVIIDVTEEGAYYHKGVWGIASDRDIEENEIATKGDIAGLAGAMHFKGKFTSIPETADYQNGDVIIVEAEGTTVEYVLLDKDGTKTWIEVGKEGVYATQAALTAEEAARTAADNALQADINTKVTGSIEGTNGTAYIFNEADGGGAKFVNEDGLESFVGVNDGGVDGLAAQIYADKLVNGKWTGAKLDVTNEGMYYTVGDKSFAERAVEANEIATKGDITSAIEEGVEGAEAIKVTTASGKNTISLELDNITQTTGLTQNSGLIQSENGLRINDGLTWVFNCGDASNLTE